MADERNDNEAPDRAPEEQRESAPRRAGGSADFPSAPAFVQQGFFDTPQSTIEQIRQAQSVAGDPAAVPADPAQFPMRAPEPPVPVEEDLFEQPLEDEPASPEEPGDSIDEETLPDEEPQPEDDEEEAPQKRPDVFRPTQRSARDAKKKSRWPKLVLIIVAILLVAAAAYGLWDTNFRYDDAVEIQGTWKVGDGNATVVIDESQIHLTSDVTYSYTIDPSNKTLSFSFGKMSGTATYLFSDERKTLEITDPAETGVTGSKAVEAMSMTLYKVNDSTGTEAQSLSNNTDPEANTIGAAIVAGTAEKSVAGQLLSKTKDELDKVETAWNDYFYGYDGYDYDYDTESSDAADDGEYTYDEDASYEEEVIEDTAEDEQVYVADEEV